jgi:hypothetical protein
MLLDVINPIARSGIVYLFEDWLRPHPDSGKLDLSSSRGGWAYLVHFSIIPEDASCPHCCVRS